MKKIVQLLKSHVLCVVVCVPVKVHRETHVWRQVPLFTEPSLLPSSLFCVFETESMKLWLTQSHCLEEPPIYSDLLVSSSGVLGLKARASTPGFFLLFLNHVYGHVCVWYVRVPEEARCFTSNCELNLDCLQELLSYFFIPRFRCFYCILNLYFICRKIYREPYL